jgi:hypothetical protein
VRAPTIGVATPTQDAVFCVGEPRMLQDTTLTNRLPRVVTPNVATPTKDSIYIVDELRDALRHDIIEPTLSVATYRLPSQRRLQFQIKLRVASNATRHITNRHRAFIRRQKIPGYMSLVKAQDKMLENQLQASRRRIKIPYKMCMSRGKPLDKTLAKRRRA